MPAVSTAWRSNAIWLREGLRDEKRDAEGASRDRFGGFAALATSLLNKATYAPIVAV